MVIVRGNILAVKQGFICHQVNCQGAMGAGLAKAIRNVWPKVYEDYLSSFQRGELTLGQVLFTTIETGKLYVASMCGQYSFGRGKRQTDYPALGQCLNKVKDWYVAVGESKLPIYIPYNIGCGLGGGEWSIVSTIIKRETPEAIVVKL